MQAVQTWQTYLDTVPRTDPRASLPFVDVPLFAQNTLFGVLHVRGVSPNQIDPAEVPDVWIPLIQIVARHAAQVLLTLQQQHQMLERELRRAEQHDPVGILMIQVDNLPRLVRSQGQAASDTVLRAVGQLLHNFTGPVGLSYRLRDHAYLLVLPDSSAQQTYAWGERICEAVPGLNVLHNSRVLDPTTVSVGIRCYPISYGPIGATPDQVIRAVEAATLRAEIMGGNRVME
ncbi:MAG: diguanylate cyclase [Chloroflexaceae bacterium]|nr:diguanylate cyclase [Chloroflexaceae bacterium]